tara:strand:+ start:31999 stop:32856 length:858 start_codon:yes stop_codon:yes gene_type:complete
MQIKQILAIGVAIISTVSQPSFAAEITHRGVFALPGMNEKVTGELIARETGLLTRELLISFTDKATGRLITDYEEELTQELHVLATDSNFSSFIHEHVGKNGPDGRFSVTMHFPKAGTYYVYADVMPKGLGQQVIRFEVAVDVAVDSAVRERAVDDIKTGFDGPYSVELDASSLRVGIESMMTLMVLKDGKLAMDLGLYLGVPAHAVFVNTDDLDYVHAHAMAMDAPKGSHSSHGPHDYSKSTIPAKLMLHATPPRAGQYALWIQFKGDGQVRTVPFVITVPAAQ